MPGQLLTVPYTAVQFLTLSQCKVAAERIGLEGMFATLAWTGIRGSCLCEHPPASGPIPRALHKCNPPMNEAANTSQVPLKVAKKETPLAGCILICILLLNPMEMFGVPWIHSLHV